MRNGAKIFSVFLYIVMMSIVMQSAGCGSSETNKVEVGDKAPDFRLESMEGKKVSLEDYRGKTVLLDFGASWCGYCMKTLPKLKEIHRNYSDKIDVIYMDIQETKAKVKSLINSYDMRYTVLLDEDGYATEDYKVLGIPTILLIDKEGIIRYRGHTLPENLEDFITE